jgi:hypothetical protein
MSFRNSVGSSSLPQHGERLGRREKAIDLSSLTIGVVSASYPKGEASSSRNPKRPFKSTRHHGVAAQGMVPTGTAKTMQVITTPPWSGKTDHLWTAQNRP